MKYIPNAMKFGTRSKASTVIINMTFEIADLHPKSNTWAIWSQNCNVPDLYEIWHSEQIMNILIGIDDINPKLQICEIWSQNDNVLLFF